MSYEWSCDCSITAVVQPLSEVMLISGFGEMHEASGERFPHKDLLLSELQKSSHCPTTKD